MLVKRTLSPGVESHGGPSPCEATGAMQLLSYTQQLGVPGLAPGSGVTLVFLPLVRADGACASFPPAPLCSLDTEDTCGVLFIPADQDLALLRPPQNLRAPQAHRGDLCLRGPGAACAPLCSGCRGPWTPREVPPLAQHPGRQTSIYPTFSTSAPPTPGQSWSSPHRVEDPSTRPKSRSPAVG